MRSLQRIFCALVISAGALIAQNKTIEAVFTPSAITVDGKAGDVWSKAAPQAIAICMNAQKTAQLNNCQVSGTVQALWNGPTLYLLFHVTDPVVTTSAQQEMRRSGVQVYVDQYNDKFPKFEEDDGYFMVSAAGQQSGNRPNANLPYYPTVWATHLQSSAATTTDGGYIVESAWSIGDLPLRNGTKIGMEFVINAVTGPAPNSGYQLFWSSGNNKGVNDNTMWGDVVLSGYDGKSPLPLNTYMLERNIAKASPSDSSATGLVHGIWKDESAVDGALAAAKTALASAKTQAAIDSANSALQAALNGLRRAGEYPDPYDLPSLATLPDPFTFANGGRARSATDWDKRRAEIRDLAQYYEFGFMPPRPQSLTATSAAGVAANSRTITVTVQDSGKSASFAPVLYLPASGTAPYPVIVEESFRAQMPPNPAFIQGGYAVLSIPTLDNPAFGAKGIASDDGNHTGAFFTLYPYKLDREGDDRGVLLAWAWGASRGVDALEYLAAHDSEYANLLDLKKLVVTGFSRWGKAALLTGLLDDRFQVTAPGGSGSGGAAPYRYDSFGNRPFRSTPFGNEYPWGRSTGAETMGDHVRHQTHNSNEMIRRFLNEPRMYRTSTPGYGDRLPFDHHEMIAAIAPRAVIIDNTNDDYADNAEGDSIGFEGAMPVFRILGAPQNLALDIFMGGGGHSLKPSQAAHIVQFANMVLFGKPLADDVKKQLSTDPYLDAGTYSRYYGGLQTMMPWQTK
ncbi:MAG TPA: sugar-binding protein [Bryobacteraceae bacterium]|nr:sugar-binding protein [Bryobacteraceae bacterium]